ncbi:MAG: alpha/beta hydrolase [Subtercola sp.]|nr:alpha/beta hydrolase [Subtercola sp.]
MAIGPDLEIRYGMEVLHIADVYLPPSPSLGLVILLHGGFWRTKYDRTHLRPLARALAENGFSVALPEYRRIGDEGGGHPGTFDDIELAVAVLPRLVNALIPDVHRVARVAVVGHSAGGQLALWSQRARRSGGEVSRVVDRVVSLAGVLDMAEARRLHLSSDAVAELLNESAPGFCERLAAADPMRLAIPDHATTRTVLLHGTKDTAVPVDFSRAYAVRDASIEFHELPQAGHYELIDPQSDVFPVLLGVLQRS